MKPIWGQYRPEVSFPYTLTDSYFCNFWREKISGVDAGFGPVYKREHTVYGENTGINKWKMKENFCAYQEKDIFISFASANSMLCYILRNVTLCINLTSQVN